MPALVAVEIRDVPEYDKPPIANDLGDNLLNTSKSGDLATVTSALVR
jgi:hypothetical protein